MTPPVAPQLVNKLSEGGGGGGGGVGDGPSGGPGGGGGAVGAEEPPSPAAATASDALSWNNADVHARVSLPQSGQRGSTAAARLATRELHAVRFDRAARRLAQRYAEAAREGVRSRLRAEVGS